MTTALLGQHEGFQAIEENDKEGHKPFDLAMQGGHLQAGKVILQTGIMENSLLAALEQGLEDVAKELLKMEGKEELLQPRNDDGQTPLHIASMKGFTEVVKIILRKERGKKLIGKADKYVKTAKVLAQAHRHWAIVDAIDDAAYAVHPAMTSHSTQTISVQAENVSISSFSNSATVEQNGGPA